MSVSHHFYAAVLTSPALVFFLSLKLRSRLPSFGHGEKDIGARKGKEKDLNFFPFPATQHLRLPD